jgi:hypothetical protein
MVKDKRYSTVKKLIVSDQLNSFHEIFDIIPKSVVAKDLGMNNMRFSRLMTDVGRFMLKDLHRLADFIEVEGAILVMLADKQLMANKKRKRLNC